LVLLSLPALSGDPTVRTVQAATLTVCPSGPPACGYARIQDAVNAASPGDTISVATGTYTETVGISTSLTLVGTGAGSTIIDGHGSGTVVTVNLGATVAISAVTVQNGFSATGGGIANGGTLTLTDSIVSSNTGVGIANTGGTLTLTDSTVSSNSSTQGGSGGGIENNGGTLTLSGSTVSGNSAPSGDGSGIYIYLGTVTLIDSTVSGNGARGGYGGVYVSLGTVALIDSTVSGNTVSGIYIYLGTVTLTDSTVSGNSANYSSGGIYNNAGTLTLTGSTVSGNSESSTSGDGGGIWNGSTITLANSTISGNTAPGNGGGLANLGIATLTNSTISGNTSGNVGGGIDNEGGAVTLTNNTISGNSAQSGGGIYNYQGSGAVTLTNSTVVSNTATIGGGGIFNEFGTLTVADSTVSGNNAGGGDGGGIANTGIVSLSDTILAGNTGFTSFDCAGSLTSGGYNLVGIGDGCGLSNGQNGDQIGTSANPINARLGPLQDNGGPTFTMAPQPGSPAIDAVAPSNCVLSTDQRGQPRPDEAADNGVCDIGAVEVPDGPQATNTPTATATAIPTSTPTNSPTATPTHAPTLIARPTSGVFGQTVTYTGTNFGTKERVNLYLDSTGNPPFYAITSTLTGSFVATTTVGQTVFGAHNVLAVGQVSHDMAATPFNIKARLILSPASGAVGTTIHAYGLGYGGAESVTLHWGSASGPILATATSNGRGTAATTFRVPSSPAGSYLVYATGQRTGAVAVARFTVT
jgi:hypothetical protein